VSTPASLTDLVQYQDGAVVSHALAKSKAGNVTLFAFDAGEGLSEHTTPFEALLLVVEGKSVLEGVDLGGRRIIKKLVRLPAGIPHSVRAPQRFKMMLIMLR
jgi:quercetin dioxygenase-like cupin family protein